MINIGLGQVSDETLGGTQEELTGGNYCSQKQPRSIHWRSRRVENT
jgi:hypothetical protein